jgi:hypothetical protein
MRRTSTVVGALTLVLIAGCGSGADGDNVLAAASQAAEDRAAVEVLASQAAADLAELESQKAAAAKVTADKAAAAKVAAEKATAAQAAADIAAGCTGEGWEDFVAQLASRGAAATCPDFVETVRAGQAATEAMEADSVDAGSLGDPETVLQLFLAAWRASDDQSMNDLATKEAVAQFSEEPSDWAEFYLTYDDTCALSGGRGECSFNLVSPEGGGFTYLVTYAKTSSGGLRIDGFDALGGGM